MDLRPHIERFARRFAELEAQLSDPRVFDNPAKAQELTREYARLKELVAAGNAYLQCVASLEENRKLLANEPADSELAHLAQEEVARLEAEEQRLALEVQAGLVPPDPTDSRNTIIEIRAGAGGAESALFAADLYRMFTRYAENHRWKVEAMDSNPSDLGGFKEVIARIAGKGAYSKLKFESGGHRVQRVPATETQGRIHTSAATVAVMPEADEVADVELNPAEIKVDTYRASGAGGQHVNKTDSAVRMTHLPTGIVVECQDDRSQHKNRARALALLRARIKDVRERELHAKEAATRKSLVGSGDRSDRVRTYNVPQGRVTDHRIKLDLYRIAAIMDGDLDEIVDALAAEHQAEQLAALGESAAA
jgi:peptide chain release factor 1